MNDFWWNLYYNYPMLYSALNWLGGWIPSFSAGIYATWATGTLCLIGYQAKRFGYFTLKGITAAVTWPLLLTGGLVLSTLGLAKELVTGKALPPSSPTRLIE